MNAGDRLDAAPHALGRFDATQARDTRTDLKNDERHLTGTTSPTSRAIENVIPTI